MAPALITATSVWADHRIASAMRLPMAASRVRTVAARLSSSIAVVPIGASSPLFSSSSNFATIAATSGSGAAIAVDNAELRPPPYATPSGLFTDIDDDVDRGDIVGVVARLYHGGAAAILDEQIVGVASEKEIDCAAAKDLVTLFAGDVSNRDDEVGSFAAQRLSLVVQGGNSWEECQVPRIGCADTVV